MKIELTDLSPVKKSMTIEVPPEAVAQETDEVLRGYRRKARIPGFRAGKAPLAEIRRRFAEEVREDVRERVLARFYREAAREKGLHPIADPVLDEVRHEEGQPFTFKTTFEVLPEFELRDYKGIEVRRPSTKVPAAEIDAALEEIRQSRVQLITEEGREAAEGDVVVTDVEGTPEGGETFRRERMLIEVGAADNLPRFNAELAGAVAGETREFRVDYPEDYGAPEMAGKTVAYRLRIHEVKRKELPELDDELARDLGDFDDLAALRARVEEDLRRRNAAESDRAVRQALLDKLLLANPVVLPDALVEDEIRSRLEELVRRLMAQGLDPEQAKIDWVELRKKQEEPARKSVHARLLLDAVARAEGLVVEDKEIEARIRHDAQAMGQKVERLRARLKTGPGLQMLRSQLLREKSLDLLSAVANIQNEE